MFKKGLWLFLLLFWMQTALWAQQALVSKGISVHDPVMIKQGETYYLFCTGRGIAVWSSPDMKSWKQEKPVFASAPEWALEAVPGFRNNHIWAPDIQFYKGTYYLYYSISAFGKNTSCIGVATNTTLDAADPNYKWVDHGKVIESVPGATNWNAIDPNLVLDKKGQPWLTFGSFWGGLQLVKINKNLLQPAEDKKDFRLIASRKKEPTAKGANPIEAPFIFRKGRFLYLFASIDYCCKGAQSDYKMIVGRAKKVEGPYLDKGGTSLSAGGGSLLLQGNQQWHGVGHNSVYTFDGTDYLVFHGYDASANGRSKLRIEKLAWSKDGWPEVIVAENEQ